MAINLTAVGSPTFSAAKFSNGLNSSAGNLLTAAGGGSSLQASTFTIEFWGKTSQTGGFQFAFSVGSEWWGLSGGTLSSNSAGGGSITTTNYADGAWHHYATCYNGTTMTTFVDGTQVDSRSSSTTSSSWTAAIYVGGQNASTYPWVGQLDEMRFSKTVRYTSSFTPQTANFASDANTMALWHLEDGTDSAGGITDAVSAISGLSARYRADTITGVASGGSIASWPDSSTNGFTATQATTANQPTLTTSSINGKPAATFNGTSMLLNSNAPAGSAAQTIIAVIKTSSLSGHRTIRGGATGALQYRIQTDNSQSLVKQTTTNIGSGSTNTPVSAAAVVIATYDSSGNFNFYLNGTSTGSGTNYQSLTASSTTIGSKSNGEEYFYGDMAELIVYTKILSTAERASVDTYAQDRYGITVSDYTGASNTTTSRFVRSTDLTNLVLAITGIQAANTQTANYTLAKTDIAKVIEMNVASANTLTIPTNATVGFPVGAMVSVYQGGAGTTTITPATGVTLRSSIGASLKNQYTTINLRQRAVDEWVLSGTVGFSVAMSDSFDRADSTSSLGSSSDGGSWTVAAGTWGIISNQAYNLGGTGGMAVRDTGSTNHYVEYKMNVYGSGVLVIRFTDVNNWYGLVQGGGNMALYKFVSGTGSSIANNISTVANGDVIRLYILGSSIILYKNGTQVYSMTDSSITSGTKVGMRADSTDARFDNFNAGPLLGS